MAQRLYRNPIEIAHQAVANILKPDDIAIDATAGNGHDTAFLANLVGEQGKVYAFDIQQEALNRTKEKLEKEGLLRSVELIHSGHENIQNFVNLPVNAVMFNLGYLPGSDKKIVTRPETTSYALEQALNLLKENGLITLTVYTGHEGGSAEWCCIKNLLQNLPKEMYDVTMHSFLNRTVNSPFTVLIQRLPV